MKFPIKIKIPPKLTNFYIKAMTKVKHKSPEICLGIGIVTGVGAVILVGIKTWKNKDLLMDDAAEIVRLTDYDPENDNDPNNPLLTEEERIIDLKKAKKEMRMDIVKTYWIPVVLTISSISFTIGGYRILRKELATMTAAYALLLDSYKRYIQNDINRNGIESYQDNMHGIKMVDTIDEETGEVVQKAIVQRELNCSRYARWFDEGNYDSAICKWIWRNPNWHHNKIECARRVKMIQSSLNDTLHMRGWMKLNEAYMAFGLPCSEEGEHVGWVLGSGHDDFIDVAVFPDFQNGRHQLPINKKFLDERDPQNNCLLDFNVDGCIDYIFKDILEYDNRSYISYDKRKALQ